MSKKKVKHEKENKKKEKMSNEENKSEEINNDSPNDENMQDSSDEKIIDFNEQKAKLESEKDDLSQVKEELSRAQEEIKDLKNTVQRTQADFINYKRRTEEEKMRISAMANESIIIELLAVIDNFERALEHPSSDAAFLQGVELIKKQILDLLEKHSVKEIPTDIDFDPNFHYAVMQEEGEESGKILEVFQKGYTLKEKVIRPAMVKVSQ